MEERTLLSAIVWTNRGSSPGPDTDGFNAVFGANANTARGVVDAILSTWQTQIVSFNQSGGGNTITLTIAMDTANGLGGSARVVSFDSGGKPTSGEILLLRGTNGLGAGWYLDPAPNDFAEFQGGIVNAFAAGPTPGGPAVGLADFYSVISAEIEHTLGLWPFPPSRLGQDPNGFLTNTGLPDAAFNGVGRLFTFNGPSVKALLTSNNGGSGGQDLGAPVHVAEPHVGNQVTSGGITFRGAQDPGNAVGEGGRRYLPSRLSTLFLQDAYNYTTFATFSNFYANLNTTTGALVVSGGQIGEAIYGPGTPSNDAVTLSRSGSNLVVSVTIGNFIPGTGPTTPLVSTFAMSNVASISIQTQDGDDTVTLDFSGGSVIPTGGLAVDGGAGTNSLTVMGTSGDDIFTVNSTQVTIGASTVTYSSVGSVTVNGGDGNDLFDVIPSSTIAFQFNGGNPSPPTMPGDVLTLQLSCDITNIAFTIVNGNGTWTFGNRLPIAFTSIEELTNAIERPAIMVFGADAGGGPHVRVLDARTKAEKFNFFAYDPSFVGGVRVAIGDVNGDRVADIITGAGPGGGPHVRVFDGRTGAPLGGPLGSFFAFTADFNGGVFVAAGDINGDKFADVVVTADAGGGPHVRAFSGKDGSVLASFFAYGRSFTGGVRVAVGDANGDNKADIITGAGPGGGPHVKVFSGVDFSVLRSYFAYDLSFTGGVYVATGNFLNALNLGCGGFVDILTGAGAGGGLYVEVFNGATGGLLRSFLVEDFTGPIFFDDGRQLLSGVRVGAADINGDGIDDLLVGFGPEHQPIVKVYDGLRGVQLDEFFAFDPFFQGGFFLAGGR